MKKSLREEQMEKFFDTLMYSHWDLGLLADKLIELKESEK